MKKYDYLKILTGFNQQEYSIFYRLSMDEEHVAMEIFNAIKASVPGCSPLFFNNPDKFLQWFTFYSPENETLSYFDTKLIGHIHRNKSWAKDYYGDLNDTEAILIYLIASWQNKTKTLKANLNMLHMLYLEYVRFLNSNKGQDFLYGKSLSWLTDDETYEEGLYYEDKPYWETELYRQQQLMKFKKTVLLKGCKNALENLEMRVIWQLTFEGTGKFNIKEAERMVWHEIGENAISHTALYRSLKKLRIQMLEEIYNHLDFDFDYFRNVSFMMDGEVITFKKAIYKWLVAAKIDLECDLIKSNPETNIKVVDIATNWAFKHGLRYDTQSECPNVLVRIKGDSTGTAHKGWKLYFYKGGGYKDFYNDRKGSYKDFE